MIFVDPKTGKEYQNVIEAAKAVLCPGPCIDCPLRDLDGQDNTKIAVDGCILWAYDHPIAFAERMGLVIKDTSREDMTLGEVKELCTKRHGEFHSEACTGCILYNPRVGDCAMGTRYMAPMDWELYTGLQFNNFAERKQLNGLYDAYGPGVMVHRYSKTNLVLHLSETSSTFPLPSKWLPNMPEKSHFSLDEARKNKFMFVSLGYDTPDEKAPDRQPSFGPTEGCGQPQQGGQIQQEEQ